MADRRGQAFTLEGVIGAMILLTAVLFALNSAVLLPSTGETGNQAAIEQEAADVMEVAADEGVLSETVRCYDPVAEEWFGEPGTATQPPPDSDLRTVLDDTFADRDRSYNVEIAYGTGSGTATDRLVYQGASTRNGVTVSRTVTLYEEQPLMEGDGCETEQGENVGNPEYPIPRTTGSDDYIYNVVEVRLTIR